MARPKQQSDPDSRPDVRRGSRRRRWALALLAALGLALFLPVIAWKSGLVRDLVLARVEFSLGAQVDVESISIGWDATLAIQDLRLSAAAIDGEPGQVLRADRVELTGSWTDLLKGNGQFREIVLSNPRFRVSRDRETGSINLAALTVPVSDDGDVVEPPQVVVTGGVVELGEHDQGRFDLLRAIQVEGQARPVEDDAIDGYEIVFAEGVSDAQGAGLVLKGLITPGGLSFQLDGLDLSQWTPEHMPERFRDVFALMRIEGGIPKASVRVTSDGATEGLLEVSGVSLNLPFDAQGEQAAPGEMVRLRDVSGSITVNDTGASAQLRGTLGDLPSVVTLKYEGLERFSAFECTIETKAFQLRSNPEILPLAPRIVKRRLNDFNNPTAIVDATVRVARANPTPEGPAPLRVEGELAFREGSASFEGFPYPFINMRGLAKFDDQKIEIVEIIGSSVSGARLNAQGVIQPPRSGAQVDLRIAIDDVPLDDLFLGALNDDRRQIVDALLDDQAHRQLQARGLIRSPERPGPGRPFTLGGIGSVLVNIHRPLGEDSEYDESIVVRLPRVGMVPSPFPYPIVAQDLVIEIGRGEAKITQGTFAGLSGGTASVQAVVDLRASDGPGVSLQIDAQRVPAESLLIAALPGGLDPEPSTDSPAAVLTRLGIQGVIDCQARIGARAEGKLGYDIDVEFEGLTASPAHDPALSAPGVTLQRLVGTMAINEDHLHLSFDSALCEQTQPDQVSGQLSLVADLALPGLDPDTTPDSLPFRARIDADIVDTRVAIEDLLRVVTPDTADRVGQLRADRRPEGAVRTEILVRGDARATDDARLDQLDITVAACDQLSFDADGGRYRLTVDRGEILVSGLDAENLQFNNWSAEIALDDGPACVVEADGQLPVGGSWTEGQALDLRLWNLELDSDLVRRVASPMIPETLNRRLDEHQVSGLFDADLHVRAERPNAPPEVTGTLRPRSIALTVNAQSIRVEALDGQVTILPDGGAFDALRAIGDGWWVDLKGRWTTLGDGAAILEGTLAGRSEPGLTPPVDALLPEGLREALQSVEAEVEGPLIAERVDLSFAIDPVRGTAHAVSGRVGFERASARVGIGISKASGYLDFDSTSDPTGQRRPDPNADLGIAAFDLGLVIEQGLAAGIEFTDAAMRIASDPVANAVVVPAIRADVHGGRVTGAAIIETGDRAAYQAEFRLSGAPLGEMLADWEHAAGIERATESNETAPERLDAESRGIVDAGFSLAGPLDDPNARRGRGHVTVGGQQGARVMRLPLLLPLIEVSNLQVPRNDPLDFGEAVFVLDGDRVIFERLGVFAQSVEIFGFGQMTLPDLGLDLRVTSRAASRLPIMSEFLEKIRDELVMTRVGGNLGDPEVSIEQFTRTRRLLTGALGQEFTEAERRMLDIERQSREAERREFRVPRRSGSR